MCIPGNYFNPFRRFGRQIYNFKIVYFHICSIPDSRQETSRLQILQLGMPVKLLCVNAGSIDYRIYMTVCISHKGYN